MQETIRLGIDFGRKKVGLAIADSFIASPLRVIRGSSMEELINNTLGVIKKLKVSEIIVGVSEGEIAREARIFGKKLALEAGVELKFTDEVLTTHEAKRKAIEAGIGQKKRQKL